MSFDFEAMKAAAGIAGEEPAHPVKQHGKVIAYVRRISAAEGLTGLNGFAGDVPAPERAAIWLSVYCCDENRNSVLTLAQARELVSTAPFDTVQRIVNVGHKLNNVAAEPDIEKN